jgi:hypothetical protein
MYACTSASSSSVKSIISSSSSSSATTGVEGVIENHKPAKNHPPDNSSAFRAVAFSADFFSAFHGKVTFTALVFQSLEIFQFFSKSFLIFTRLASETVAVLAVISFHITFSKYLEKVCLETHNSFITSSIRGI